MTKEQIKEMMNNLELNKLVYEDENNLEYTNPCYGETISFEFKNNILIQIYS